MGARFAWLLVAACGGSEPPVVAPANSAPGDTLPEISAVLDVCTGSGIDAQKKITRWASAQWPAPKYAGKTFELVSRLGPVATVRITSHEIDCDDCPGAGAAADNIEVMAEPLDACYLAIGPLAHPLPRANRDDVPGGSPVSAHAVTDWTPTEQFDLDGDGRPDVTRVMRCAHVVATGCSDHVCDEVCEGVRQHGGVRGDHCEHFIPDVDDCVP